MPLLRLRATLLVGLLPVLTARSVARGTMVCTDGTTNEGSLEDIVANMTRRPSGACLIEWATTSTDPPGGADKQSQADALHRIAINLSVNTYHYTRPYSFSTGPAVHRANAVADGKSAQTHRTQTFNADTTSRYDVLRKKLPSGLRLAGETVDASRVTECYSTFITSC
jgi:hypothetical protein